MFTCSWTAISLNRVISQHPRWVILLRASIVGLQKKRIRPGVVFITQWCIPKHIEVFKILKKHNPKCSLTKFLSWTFLIWKQTFSCFSSGRNKLKHFPFIWTGTPCMCKLFLPTDSRRTFCDAWSNEILVMLISGQCPHDMIFLKILMYFFKAWSLNLVCRDVCCIYAALGLRV